MTGAQTLYDKIRGQHEVHRFEDGASLIYIDRIMLHERTGSVALANMQETGHKPVDPNMVFATIDHIVDTKPVRPDLVRMPGGEIFVTEMRRLTRQMGLRLFDIDDPRQGIVHVIAPEQGIALPGITMVCPDSHTCTLGGLGALAWGIGSTDCEHAMVTRTLRVPRHRQIRVTLHGETPPWISAKDIVLHLIATHGAGFARDHVVEFCGPVVDEMEIEARLTLCNMGVEFGSFTAIIAPDAKAVEYAKGRPFAPDAVMWPEAVATWAQLYSDPDARFDAEIRLDVSGLGPAVSWGTSPEHAGAVCRPVPVPVQQHGVENAITYMDVEPGAPVKGLPIDGAFIGSCTNARISDLRLAARHLRGRRVPEGVRAICVPGSFAVAQQARREGLVDQFIAAGFEWHEAGCAMCFHAGGAGFAPQARVISSTNRNFEGRQGPGVRTHIASPATVAWSAVNGCISDVREATCD